VTAGLRWSGPTREGVEFLGVFLGLGVGAALALPFGGRALLVGRLAAIAATCVALLELSRRLEEDLLDELFLVVPLTAFAALAVVEGAFGLWRSRRPVAAVALVASAVGLAAFFVVSDELDERRAEASRREAAEPAPAVVGQERILWRYDFPGGFATGPAVADGQVMAIAGDDLLVAVDRRTGRERWRTRVGFADFPEGPLVHEGRVYYTGSGPSGLEVVSARSGKRLWSRKATAAGASLPVFASRLAVYADHERALIAVDAATGRERWRFAPALSSNVFAGFDSPLLAGGRILVAADVAQPAGWKLFALEPTRGRVLWSFATDLEIERLTADARGAYFRSGSYQYALAMRDGSVRLRLPHDVGVLAPEPVVYTYGDQAALRARDVPSGRTRWLHRPSFDSETSEPAIADRTVFVSVRIPALPPDTKQSGSLDALDEKTGKIRWRVDVLGGAMYRPAVADDAVYVVGTSPYRLYAIRR
jgi:outer membrane protein assembly factor BamB